MFAVSFVVFALVSASPIDPVQMNVGQAAYMTMSEAKRAQLAQYWGVGTPLLERYANWLASVLQGDWGTSLRFNAPVMEVLGNRAANSLALLGIAWVASGVLGLLLGGQRLLRQISGNAKLADLFPDLHVRFLRSKSCSAAFWIQHTTRRAKRKAPRERERATGRRVSRGGTGRA